MRRSISSRQESHASALAELATLESKAQAAAVVRISQPKKCTAAAKWSYARTIAEQTPLIEAWGSGSPDIVGTFRFSPTVNAETAPPSYQSQSDQEKWLYVIVKGQWFVGGVDSRDAREKGRQKGFIRSREAVEPGTLPHLVGDWEVMIDGDWRQAQSFRFWLPLSVKLEWQQARARASKVPVFQVRGTGEDVADGLFDFIPDEGVAGDPPVFRHQIFRNVWMFLAKDQRWWIGTEFHMSRKMPSGIACSFGTLPGQHPIRTQGTWMVAAGKTWRDAQVEITMEEEALTAADKWLEARREATNLEFWGNSNEHGTYILHESSSACEREPPVYQYRSDPSVWVYVADDGHWWFGNTGCKSKRIGGAYMRSKKAVEPGILPDEVECWMEARGKEWVEDGTLSFFTPQAASAAWDRARVSLESDPVVKLRGAPAALEVDGLYDFWPEVQDDGGSPVFRHQISHDNWMYLASDGRWWIGTRLAAEKRQPIGVARSDPVRPGHLPSARGWQVYDLQRRTWDFKDRISVS